MPKKDAGKAKKTVKLENIRCVIALDESYTRTGISIAVDGKLKKVSSINFSKNGSKASKRRLVASTLRKAIESCLKHYGPHETVVIVERIRTFTQTTIMHAAYLKSMAALIAYISDTAEEFGIKTYSVDTRAWKSAILGSSKPIFEPIEGVKDPQKFGSVRKAIELGFKEELSVYRNNRAFHSYNDDAADSACIALYGFVKNPLLMWET